MKRLFTAMLVASLATLAGAQTVTRSSYTTTNDTQLLRSPLSTNTIVHVLSGVIVSSPTSSGLLKIYGSTWTTSGLVTSINLNAIMNYDFHDITLSGIYYVTTGNVNGVTILYKD